MTGRLSDFQYAVETGSIAPSEIRDCVVITVVFEASLLCFFRLVLQHVVVLHGLITQHTAFALNEALQGSRYSII